jgi:hypothetical protein
VWFGQTLIDDEDPDGALVTIPISPESESGRPPWAVVQIRLPPGERNDLRDSRFLDMLEAGKWALLLEAVRME